MTREEARQMIESMGKYLSEGNPIWETEPVKEATRMAIEALSNQQKWIDEELQNYLIENADLVTCKDCKHWASAEDYDCEIHSGAFGAEDFCSYGERKGGDEK